MRTKGRKRERAGHCKRTILAVAITFGVFSLAACSVFTSPSAYWDWGYERFIAFDTFANRPLPKWCADAAEDPSSCPSVEDERSLRKAKTIAASGVPWQMNSTCRNEFERRVGGLPPTRAEIEKECEPDAADSRKKLDSDYIAIGISGGGTKSAVFATESLLALDQWGLLGRADAISSVSGGSFAAALYAVSCDPDFCDEDDSARLRWRDPDAGDRAIRDLIWPMGLKRLFLGDMIERALTHRTSNTVLGEAIDWRILARPDGAYDLAWRDYSPFPALVRTAPDRTHRLEFRHLNPRRPNLILNAAHAGSDRHLVEAEANIAENQRRLRDKANWTHFAFTDHYFETMLHSDLSRYPVANAVAASAAFPLIIDYTTLGRFNRRGERGNAHGIDFIHLTDGGAQDNHGLTEIRLSLEDIFGVVSQDRPPNPKALQPTRVLVLVLDSSLNDLNGVPRANPHPLGFETLLSIFRPFNLDQATSIMLATNAAQHDERFRSYLKQDVEKECKERPEGDGSVCAQLMRIGLDQMDGYDSVLIGAQFMDCETAELQEQLNPSSDNFKNRTMEQRRKQQLHCRVMRILKTAEARDRLGLGRYHPQCYVEATRTAQTSFSIDEDMGDCLRHAARWAVATKMTELCLDTRFGVYAPVSPARGPYLPPLAGRGCEPPAGIIAPLPRECPYRSIMSSRTRTEMPRQAAHCACVDPSSCRPEDLLTGKPISGGEGADDPPGDFDRPRDDS